MTRYINRTIAGHDQFLVDYVAITDYRPPNLEQVLIEHAMDYLRSIALDKFPTFHLPPFKKIYGGKKQREFTFVFTWNESAEWFDAKYTGYTVVAIGEVEYFTTKFDRWTEFEAEYTKLAKRDHTLNFEELKYDVFRHLCGRGKTPEHGKTHKVWLKEADSKSGSRTWFRVVFLLEDNAPVIRYEAHQALELKAYDVAEIRFERWMEFEAYAKNLIKPEHMFNFDEIKAELARECAANKASGYARNVWIGGDKTISRRGYRFWFDFSNEDGTPRIRYTRYSFS